MMETIKSVKCLHVSEKSSNFEWNFGGETPVTNL